MRELTLVIEESNKASLVFRLAEDDDAAESHDEQFFLVVDDRLRDILLNKEPAEPGRAQVSGTQAGGTPTDAPNDAETAENSATEDGTAQDANKQDDSTESSSPATLAAAQPIKPNKVDPRISAPLRMRPREIQDRIRAGATVAELAEENEVTESRIEPYAHPVLLERARIADLAKQSHPVREDGPATLTLLEVLATAFAARGIDLGSTHWDAYRDASHQWVITVSWKVGLSENTAEWSYHRNGMSSATTVARNGIAADLIDPEFAQPVRKLSVPNLGLHAASSPREEVEKTRDDLVAIQDEDTTTPESKQEEEVVEGDDFLQHPESQQGDSGAKRRRRAVTPHWEDVLLGVRANTKRPRK